MKKLLSLLFVGVLALSLSACGQTSPTTDDSSSKTDESTDTTAETSEDVVAHEPGESPFDYPEVATTAQKDEYVLVPSEETIEAAFKDGTDNTSFIFYSATMVEPGETSSVVKSSAGEYTVSNSLIVPIPSGETAAVGDIVLTWWQSGSGLLNGIVTKEGAEPTVRYLDTYFETEEALKPNSFHVLSNEMEPGVSVAVTGDWGKTHGTLINLSGDKALVMGWAGITSVVDKGNLTLIPLTIDVAVGDTIMAPVIGTYDEVKVTEVFPEIGQVKGEYDWAGELTDEIFLMSQITKEF